MRVAIIGASGFIGSAAKDAFEAAGHEVAAVTAPRYTTAASTPRDIATAASGLDLTELVQEIRGCEVVINAAGLPAATSGDQEALFGANSLTPYVAWLASRQTSVQRFIHVSSAAVQGRVSVLDASLSYRRESPYATSKVLAEQVLLRDADQRLVIYRPTSVHGSERGVTQTLQRLAGSRFSLVAAPGTDPTPQVHIRQVASALVTLADLAVSPPVVVVHPWEGFTTSSFMAQLAEGKGPRMLPRWLARFAVALAYVAAKLVRRGMWGHARRLEMLLFGQGQLKGWLESAAPNLSRPHPAWKGLHDSSS